MLHGVDGSQVIRSGCLVDACNWEIEKDSADVIDVTSMDDHRLWSGACRAYEQYPTNPMSYKGTTLGAHRAVVKKAKVARMPTPSATLMTRPDTAEHRVPALVAAAAEYSLGMPHLTSHLLPDL